MWHSFYDFLKLVFIEQGGNDPARWDAFNFTHGWVVFKGGDGVHYIKHHDFFLNLAKYNCPKQVVAIYYCAIKNRLLPGISYYSHSV